MHVNFILKKKTKCFVYFNVEHIYSSFFSIVFEKKIYEKIQMSNKF